MTDTERKLKNVIFRIIDANSITGASLEEARQIFEAIQQAKKEWILEELIKAKNLTEHLSQQERNEYFDLRIKELEEIK